MDLSIIIVSYNTADLIGNCLDSVLVAHPGEKEIFVVDNASTDGSAVLIKEKFPGVDLTLNAENRGFAAANNQVIPRCRGRFLFFLNPDTTVRPDVFQKSLAFMEANPHIGLAGTKMINPDGTLQESISYRYPGERYTQGELAGLKGRIVCILGASMIARTEIIKKIGGFDEDFFLYGEDLDLGLRIRKAGFEIGFIDDAAVLHLGAQSERKTTPEELWQKKLRAEYLFYQKHYRPETISRIRRMQLLQAFWRIATLKMTLPFVMDKKKARQKLARYGVVEKFLIDARGPSFPAL